MRRRTVSLRRFLPPRPLPLEVRPLARLVDGRFFLETSAFLPPEGPCLLVLWRPGEVPQFTHAAGRLARASHGWRFEGAAVEGWVVLHVPAPGGIVATVE